MDNATNASDPKAPAVEAVQRCRGTVVLEARKTIDNESDRRNEYGNFDPKDHDLLVVRILSIKRTG